MFTQNDSNTFSDNKMLSLQLLMWHCFVCTTPPHAIAFVRVCASSGNLAGGILNCQRSFKCCSISFHLYSPMLQPTYSTCALETTRSNQRSFLKYSVKRKNCIFLFFHSDFMVLLALCIRYEDRVVSSFWWTCWTTV